MILEVTCNEVTLVLLQNETEEGKVKISAGGPVTERVTNSFAVEGVSFNNVTNSFQCRC